jgi:hypothetical protein
MLPDPIDVDKHIEARSVVPYIGGRLITMAKRASVAEGWVDRFVTDQDDQIVIFDKGTDKARTQIERIYGAVELRKC